MCDDFLMALNDGVDPTKASRISVKAAVDSALGTPSAAAGANNGTSPPAPVVTAGSDARRGSLTFGSGSAPAAGAQVVVTFGGSHGATPAIVIVNGPLGAYATSVSATGFAVSTLNAPTASQGNTTYTVEYLVVA